MTTMRPEFTPRSWYSADRKWKFVMDKHGLTDMIPVSLLDQYLEVHLPKVPRPYTDTPDHVHWAYEQD